jgi:hypothetical protein
MTINFSDVNCSFFAPNIMCTGGFVGIRDQQTMTATVASIFKNCFKIHFRMKAEVNKVKCNR